MTIPTVVRIGYRILYPAIMALLLPMSQGLAVPKIIFDTDIARVDELGKSASDIDDLGALTLLNALANLNKCEILCIVTSTRSDAVVGMIDAVNTYFHNPHIPIGIKGGNDGLTVDQNSYAQLLVNQFPHDQQSKEAPSATAIIRQVLTEASAADTIIYLHADAIAHWEYLSIGSYLESGPDGISALSGWELFAQKVDELVTYMPCLPNQAVSNNCPDWANVVTSNQNKLQRLLDTFPNRITGNTSAPAEVHVPTELWNEADTHPVKVAYQYYYTQTPPPWRDSREVPEGISLYGDPLGVFFSIQGSAAREKFSVIQTGSYVVDDEQKLRWNHGPDTGNARYFYTKPNQQSKLCALLDALMTHQPVLMDTDE